MNPLAFPLAPPLVYNILHTCPMHSEYKDIRFRIIINIFLQSIIKVEKRKHVFNSLKVSYINNFLKNIIWWKIVIFSIKKPKEGKIYYRSSQTRQKK